MKCLTAWQTAVPEGHEHNDWNLNISKKLYGVQPERKSFANNAFLARIVEDGYVCAAVTIGDADSHGDSHTNAVDLGVKK